MKRFSALMFAACLTSLTIQNSDAAPASQPSLQPAMPSGKVATEGEYVLPIEIWNDCILVKMDINGVTGWMIWDSGFSTSALDATRASRAKLGMGKRLSEGVDANGKLITLPIHIARRARVGGIRIDDSPFARIDLQQIFGPTPKPIGILGSSIIRKLNWQFDFDREVVTVSTKRREADGPRLRFFYDEMNVPRILLGINGHAGYAIVDFGYTGDFVGIPMGAASAFGSAKRSKVTGFASSSVGGLANQADGYVISDYRLTLGEDQVHVPTDMRAFLDGSSDAALLGNRFFRRFNTVLNGPDGQIILAPRARALEPMPRKQFGFTIGMHEGKAVVLTRGNNPNVTRHPDLPLLAEVAAINGESIAGLLAAGHSLQDVQIRLLRQERPMRLDLQDGRSITLLPEDDIFE